jgi:hypothetical protein
MTGHLPLTMREAESEGWNAFSGMQEAEWMRRHAKGGMREAAWPHIGIRRRGGKKK